MSDSHKWITHSIKTLNEKFVANPEIKTYILEALKIIKTEMQENFNLLYEPHEVLVNLLDYETAQFLIRFISVGYLPEDIKIESDIYTFLTYCHNIYSDHFQRIENYISNPIGLNNLIYTTDNENRNTIICFSRNDGKILDISFTPNEIVNVIEYLINMKNHVEKLYELEPQKEFIINNLSEEENS